MTPDSRRRRASSATTLVALGAAVAAAGWIGDGGPWAAIALMGVIAAAAIGIFVWSGRSDSDVPSLLGGVGDERQQLIDTRATAIAGLAMGIFSLVLALVAIARGSDNPWAVVCLVGAVSYVVALVTLRARG
jgi:hypothetical protein